MSIQYEVTTEIDRPHKEVFEYVTSPENDGEWIPSVSRAIPPDEEMGVGTTWRRLVEMPFGTNEITIECTEYDPPTRFAYRSPDGLMGGRLRNSADARFSGQGDRTHLSFSPTIEVRGFLRLFTPLIRRMTQQETTSSLEQLRSELESLDG